MVCVVYSLIYYYLFSSKNKDKKGFIPLEKLPELFTMISADTNFVGKVPACT